MLAADIDLLCPESFADIDTRRLLPLRSLMLEAKPWWRPLLLSTSGLRARPLLAHLMSAMPGPVAAALSADDADTLAVVPVVEDALPVVDEALDSGTFSLSLLEGDGDAEVCSNLIMSYVAAFMPYLHDVKINIPALPIAGSWKSSLPAVPKPVPKPMCATDVEINIHNNPPPLRTRRPNHLPLALVAAIAGLTLQSSASTPVTHLRLGPWPPSPNMLCLATASPSPTWGSVLL